MGGVFVGGRAKTFFEQGSFQSEKTDSGDAKTRRGGQLIRNECFINTIKVFRGLGRGTRDFLRPGVRNRGVANPSWLGARSAKKWNGGCSGEGWDSPEQVFSDRGGS